MGDIKLDPGITQMGITQYNTNGENSQILVQK